MEFHLIGYFKMSGDATEAQNDLESFFEDVASDILCKGAPKGCGAKLLSWSIDSDRLNLEILSDRYVRSHDAMLRLRKPLGGILGKNHHIGIRGIGVDEFTIKIESEKPLEAKIPFVSSIDYKEKMIVLKLDVSEPEIERRVPDRILALVEEKLVEDYGGKGEHWELLWESEPKDLKFDEDPTQAMVKRRWILHGSARGQWIFGPQVTKIYRTFEKIVEEEIIAPLGYEEMIFPKLVTWDVWKRSGHLKGIYPEMYYICTPKTRDPKFWEEVIDYYKVTNEVPLDMIKEKIDNPIGGMCYAQCPPFWTFLQGETLPDDIFPVKVFDRSGTSHRYESGGIHGIERVDEFHRIELLWVGTKEQVIEHSEKLQERYKYIFNDILDLQWRNAWVTPWFMAQEGLTGLSETREAGTIDYEAVLPYNGTWLEFQNLSVNGDKYPKGFNVKLQSKGDLWSGCSGIGMERWASVFLSQKGLDMKDWPEKFQEKVGELPEVFRFL
ncbi:MAG: serine--tRNA ligase [Halobacteriota archaeon]|nr:serine--tRNA ligase [Halobacteriota archaeon]